MKYMKKIQKIIPGVFLIATLFSSCTKDYEALNQNPNSPVVVPAINVFTNAEVSAISRQMGGWIQHTYLGVWSQQWCKVQYIDEDRYMPRDMSGEFNASFTNEQKNLSIVISKGTEEGNESLVAAAKVLRAYSFMYITDIWGDIPYNEAIQGFQEDGKLTPVYDSQASIYADLLAQLEEANVVFAGSSLNFGSGDVIYGGDLVLWRKLANSLKLRILNRAAGTPWSFTYNMAGGTQVTTSAGAPAMSGADAQIATILGSPLTYPIFESNDDNALLYFPGAPYKNSIYNTLYTRTDQGISETMVDWLQARNDPRIHIYAQPTPNSVATPPLEYVGFQNGRGITSALFPTISLLGTQVAYTETAPLYVLCYDEIQFIKAEHYKRVGNDAAAQTAYEDGVMGSMERWGLSDGSDVEATWGKANSFTSGDAYPVDFAAYLAEADVAWGGTDAHKFQLICEQRWAGMFGQGVQAYCEIRRTGFPERIFEYELEGAYYEHLGLPVRVQYALSEDTYNTDNVAAARGAQNIESINEVMFSTNGTTAQLWWNTRKNPIPTVTDVH